MPGMNEGIPLRLYERSCKGLSHQENAEPQAQDPHHGTRDGLGDKRQGVKGDRCSDPPGADPNRVVVEAGIPNPESEEGRGKTVTDDGCPASGRRFLHG
jgi:hypothetical protein